MKKMIILLIVSVGLLFAACATSSHCDAYGDSGIAPTDTLAVPA